MTHDQAKRKNTVLVINLQSRQAQRYYEHLIKVLNNSHLRIHKVYKIKKGTNLDAIMRRVLKNKPDLIIVGGGDGTVSDVVDYLADTKIELGILPLGTTNNFARSLGIPLDLHRAITCISNKPAKLVDLGSVNGDLFSNIAGVGLSAEIAANVDNALKRRYGRLAYAITGIKLLLRHRPFHVTISSASENLKINVQTHQLIIANGKYHAGKEIAADAKPSSRELVIFKLGGTSRLSLVWHLIDFYVGKRHAVAQSSFFIAKNITLSTDRPIAIELDGEAKEFTPASISIKPAAVLIRY